MNEVVRIETTLDACEWYDWGGICLCRFCVGMSNVKEDSTTGPYLVEPGRFKTCSECEAKLQGVRPYVYFRCMRCFEEWGCDDQTLRESSCTECELGLPIMPEDQKVLVRITLRTEKLGSEVHRDVTYDKEIWDEMSEEERKEDLLDAIMDRMMFEWDYTVEEGSRR